MFNLDSNFRLVFISLVFHSKYKSSFYPYAHLELNLFFANLFTDALTQDFALGLEPILYNLSNKVMLLNVLNWKPILLVLAALNS